MRTRGEEEERLLALLRLWHEMLDSAQLFQFCYENGTDFIRVKQTRCTIFKHGKNKISLELETLGPKQSIHGSRNEILQEKSNIIKGPE